jgi:flagellar hook-length control protein FliK
MAAAGVAPLFAPAAAAAAPAAPPPRTPVATQVAQPVAVLASGPDGSSTMTLVLTPENLGPVQVHLTVSHGTVDLTLRGAHEQGRAALLDALPDLRRDLQSAGLTCSRLDVDRDTGGSWSTQQQATAQQGHSGQHGQSDRGDARTRPWLRPADLGAVRPAPIHPSSSASSGVDVLA